MPRNRLETRARFAAFHPAALAPWLVALALCACTTEDRQAGTSTTVGNTLTGVAVLSDGRPAGRAEVSLRAPRIQVSRYGTPSSALLAFALADDSGAFSLPRPGDTTGLYLEIVQARDSAAVLRDSLQARLLAFPAAPPDSLGRIALAAPGSLTGRVLAFGGMADSAHWIGAQGTDNFVPLKADGVFRLDGLAAGSQTLVVVDIPDISIAHNQPFSFSVKFPAPAQPAATVKSGETVDLGGMLYFDRVGQRVGIP